MEGPLDLDALIGELRREAARGRAEPDFPLEKEAEIGIALDAGGPYHGADLRAVARDLETLAQAGPGGSGELATLVASAVRILAGRLDRVESRLGALAPPDPSPPDRAPDDSAPAGPDLVGIWGRRVRAFAGVAAGGGSRRILLAGTEAARWQDQLRGFDMVALDTAGDEPGGSGAIRTGPLVDTLERTGADALAAVLLAGPAAPADRAAAEHLRSALSGVTATVAVVSESPWSWQQRRTPLAAATDGGRPLAAEGWLELLAETFEGAARYDRGGRSYLVVGRRSPGGPETAAKPSE